MGDRIKPVTLVFTGLLVTVTMNILMPFMPSVPLMTAVWCVNGFAQAFMWPPMVKYLTNLLSTEDYNKACVKVSWGSYIGTIAVYLFAPLCISLLDWRFVFFISAACGLIMAFVWRTCASRFENVPTDVKAAGAPIPEKGAEKSHMKFGAGVIVMLGFTMVAIILQGILRDGITTWMPSYISDTYHLSDSISILTNVALPIMSIGVSQAALWIYTKKIKNEEACAGVMLGIGALSSLMLYLLNGRNAALSVLFAAVITACMHGANVMLISLLPGKFGKYGNVSFMSGLLNSCTYIGAALSGYGMALTAKYFGWNGTVFMWVIIAAAGAVICFMLAKPWSRFLKR